MFGFHAVNRIYVDAFHNKKIYDDDHQKQATQHTLLFEALRPIHTHSMPFPCHAVPLRD